MNEAKLFLDNLLKSEDTIVIGVSGGPDSMCLFHVLKSYQDKLNLKIICAHVNHGLRKESDEEAIFVKKCCKKYNYIFEYMKIENYVNNKFSEQEAREKRYGFFIDLVKKYNAKYLMTAHHGDDLIETIMMRIVRGSNLKGYVGIPLITKSHNYKLVRPFIYCTKDELQEYVLNNKIKYVIDKTNSDDKYTRNRYRKHLLPFLKNEDKNVHHKFLQFSEELEMAYNYIDKIVLEKYKIIKEKNYLNILKLNKEDSYIISKIIEKYIEEIQKDYLFNINKEQLNNILKLINNRSNKQVSLANGFIARRSYDKLYIEKETNITDYQYEIVDNLNVFNKYIFNIIKKSNDKSNYIIRLNSKEIKLPLIVRNKRNGDKMLVKNLNGSKKIKDILIENKIDMLERKVYPIVTDSNNEVIWIPGLKKSIFDKEIDEKYDIIIKCMEEKNE